MANFRIPCLVARTNKAGQTSWYWQPSKSLAKAGWQPIALSKNEAIALDAARARNTEVGRWKNGEDRPADVATRIIGGTVGALIARYRRDVLEGFDADGRPLLREGTKGIYRTGLKRLEAWAGDQPVAWI